MANITIRETTTGEVLAQADESEVVRVENGIYFPLESVYQRHLVITDRVYSCPYKGVCNWIDLVAPAIRADNIAWVYQAPKAGYERIAGRIGFANTTTAHTRVNVTSDL